MSAPFLEKIGMTPAHPYRIGVVEPKCMRLLKQLIDRSVAGPASELHDLSIVYGIFAELLASRSDASPTDSGWVEQCIRYMQLHYTEDINVEQIAQYFQLHRSYVSTAITKRIGQSPGQYLQSLRLQKAAQLLRDTDYSVTEIALSAGYPDLYRFSRTFSKAYGMSPTEFRKSFIS
jgi:AraC-like DNA-binding protein